MKENGKAFAFLTRDKKNNGLIQNLTQPYMRTGTIF